MDIYLIRHGKTPSSAPEHYDAEKKTMNPPLTDRGMRQAENLAARCKSIGFDLIISSDLLRAVQTAERLQAASPRELIITPAFREIDMGGVHTKSWSAYPDLYAKWSLHDEDVPYPDGESGDDVWRRCKPALETLTATQYERIAIVCHGGTIRSIVCGILDIPQQKRFFLGLPPENCSISILKYAKEDNHFYLHTFNDFSHISNPQH